MEPEYCEFTSYRCVTDDAVHTQREKLLEASMKMGREKCGAKILKITLICQKNHQNVHGMIYRSYRAIKLRF